MDAEDLYVQKIMDTNQRIIKQKIMDTNQKQWMQKMFLGMSTN